MAKQIANEGEFKENLKKLGDLYEEGKNCLHRLYSSDPAHARLYEILREMRDIAAVQMQHKHWLNGN